jgi:inorganic pyrophosphatase
MTKFSGKAFWEEMANLVVSRPIVIDRPRGKAHSHYPDLIYPLDYGYVEGTLAADGDGIDVWIGSQEGCDLTGILCTYDTLGRDAEIKLLLGCTESDVRKILHFNRDYMRNLYIPRPKEDE